MTCMTEMCIAILSLSGLCVPEVERQSLTQQHNSKYGADCFAMAQAMGIATLTYFAVFCPDFVSFPCQSAKQSGNQDFDYWSGQCMHKSHRSPSPCHITMSHHHVDCNQQADSVKYVFKVTCKPGLWCDSTASHATDETCSQAQDGSQSSMQQHIAYY